MKAPDKIYLTPVNTITVNGTRLEGLSCVYSIGDREYENEIEYIRKDALLEWAKERREAVAKEVVIREGVRLGADAAFEELIDKLNEM